MEQGMVSHTYTPSIQETGVLCLAGLLVSNNNQKGLER